MLFLRFTFLLALWLLLSGRYDWLHVGLGVVAAAVVAWQARGELLPEEKLTIFAFLGRALRLVWYSLWLALQILKANFYVLSLAMSRKVTEVINPRIICFKTSLDHDFAKYLLATSITLTPGTVTVRISGDELVVHAISDKAAAGMTDVMQEKLQWVFQS